MVRRVPQGVVSNQGAVHSTAVILTTDAGRPGFSSNCSPVLRFMSFAPSGERGVTLAGVEVV